ncbi:MAG TPA: MBL fold metallo-hydrolase, partial [Gemmataceae bacterium]
MLRFLSTLLVGAALASAGVAAEPNKVMVRSHGQSFFEIITTKGTRIVFDPHLIDAYGRNVINADLVLLSHEHSDHTQTSVVENLDKAKVLHGVKDEKGDGKKLDWNAIDETFKDVKIRTLGTFHDQMNGMQRGLNSIFILEFDGLKV